MRQSADDSREERDDEFFAFYRRVAQAIPKTIPGARREEEAEFDAVSTQRDRRTTGRLTTT